MPLSPGTSLGHYEIQSQIGAGGMGEVYLAHDTRLKRKVALKVLPLDLINNRERMRRFEQEARAASALNHPNIITIHEIGSEGRIHFIVTEFIDGHSLRHSIQSGPLEVKKALDIAAQISSALSAAHEAHIVHRDIKPENIMLRRDQIVKVLDFGLAKLIKPEPHALDSEGPTKILANTAPGMIMGTVIYMSPEQARGLEIDARTDVWSLGVVIYEMVTGRAPFEGATPSDIIAAILKNNPPGLTVYAPGIPSELERIVMKALSKDMEERYQTIEDLSSDLKSLKQRMEFEAELARAGSPERRSALQAIATDDRPTVVDTAQITPLPSQTSNTDVTPFKPASTVQITVAAKRNKSRALTVLVISVAVTISIVVFAYTRYFSGSGTADTRSIAVLPFTNMSDDPETEYLSDGISESLINSLSQIPGLKVIARSSSFKYKGSGPDPQEIARVLGVGMVLTGRVAQRGGNLLISTELMDAREGTQMWGAQYNRAAEDLLAVQAEISSEIAGKLSLRLSPDQRQQFARRETANPKAYELQLKGLYHWRKGGIENWKKAVEYYEQAIALDPHYALAYARLAGSYKSLVGNSVLDPKEFTPKAEEAAREALELDESLADAHYVLANLRTDAWDWAAAEREFKRAVELNPNLAGARNAYSAYLSVVGRHDEAIAEIQRATELDPLSLIVHANVGYRLYFARRHDQAIEALKKALELDKNYDLAHIILGYAYAAKGMYPDAIMAYEEAIKRGGDTPSVRIALGAAYAQAGDHGRARAILEQLQTGKGYVSPGELAILYTALGEREQAFATFEKAYAAHDLQLQYLGVDPHYDSLRSDPRFTDLMRRVGLMP
jgi:serine/threonine protein kinase/Tfp pilus assembly protein PilF